MPVSSTLAHVKSLLDGQFIPGNAGQQIDAFIAPPDPEIEQRNPHVYVWSADGPENRNAGKRSTPPQGAAQATPTGPAGWKIIKHRLELYLVWFSDNNDPQLDSSFPAFLDYVMNVLRCCPMPMDILDPITGNYTQLINLGEAMTYQYVPVRSTADQRSQRFDALITAPVEEWIQA